MSGTWTRPHISSSNFCDPTSLKTLLNSLVVVNTSPVISPVVDYLINLFLEQKMSDFFERMQRESKLPATHENYGRRSKAFIAWLKRKYPECWDEDSKFQLSRVTTSMVCEYIAVTSQKADGTLLAPSTPESNHSAIVDMYRTERLRIPDGLNVEWLQFIKGFKNRTADNIAAGIQAPNYWGVVNQANDPGQI